MAEVQVNSAVGLDGNAYTTSIANDKLTNKDFLQLLLKEFELQDPTSPTDSAKMLQNQLQMSQIETNIETVKAMEKLVKSNQQSSLANAANLINKVVQNGELADNGVSKEFKVSSVKMEDGNIMIEARQIMGYDKENKQFELHPTLSTIMFENLTSIH